MDGVVSAAVHSLFRALGRARAAPAFHPSGVVFTGVIARHDRCPTWFPVPAGESRVLVRVSKGVGLPGALPDILGIALRTWVDGDPWDLLLSSALGRLPFIAWSWKGARYSTIATLVGGTGSGVVYASAVRMPGNARIDGLSSALPLVFDLGVRGVGEIARVELTKSITHNAAFDPLGNAAGLGSRPRWLAALRAPAYLGSRLGRRTAHRSIRRF